MAHEPPHPRRCCRSGERLGAFASDPRTCEPIHDEDPTGGFPDGAKTAQDRTVRLAVAVSPSLAPVAAWAQDILIGITSAQSTLAGVTDHGEWRNGAMMVIEKFIAAGGSNGRLLKPEVVDIDILSPEGSVGTIQTLTERPASCRRNWPRPVIASRPVRNRVAPVVRRPERCCLGAAAIFACDGVNLSLGGRQTLRDVALYIRRRVVLGLIGLNRVGKTCLFEVLSGRYVARSGRVLPDGVVWAARLVNLTVPWDRAARSLATFDRRKLLLSV